MRCACAAVVAGCWMVLSGCEPPVAESSPAQAEEAAPAIQAAPIHSLPDLWTRKQGSDWPTFLGPTGDSKSPEKGILTKWRTGIPRIVWQQKLGTGYGAPTISRGRLFQFDRFEDVARLYCLNAETGEELWRYEYKTGYED